MWDVRAISAADADLFRRRLSHGFGRDHQDDDASLARFEAIFDLERTFAAFDGEDIVGTGAAFSLDVTVPGGVAIPMGGTTVITVLPTHRRRGVLRAMMKWHLDEVASRGEPLAGLWASEGSIYRRFGYGIATEHCEVSFRREGISIPVPEEGTVRLIDPEEAAKILPRIYEEVRFAVPGMLSRSDAWWNHRVIADPEDWREGRTANRHALYERDGQALGYATYRQKGKWDDNLPTGEVAVEEIITLDDQAHSRLWSFLANIDLFPKVEYWNLPLDDPLPFKVEDSRRLKRLIADALWVRLMDIPDALGRRRYLGDGSITMEVNDDFRPETSGVYRLDVADGVGSCERTMDEPEVSMDIDVLGHLYLGGGNGIAMARAGRVNTDLESAKKLHRIFRGDQAPWCPEVF